MKIFRITVPHGYSQRWKDFSRCNNSSLMARALIHLLFPEVPGISHTSNFPSSFTAGCSSYMPFSPVHDTVSITKSSSSINSSTTISSNNSFYNISSSPMFCTCLSILLLSLVMLSVKFFSFLRCTI